MNKEKQKRLEKKGWKIGSTKEFLGLTDDEVSYIELKLNELIYQQRRFYFK